MGELYDAAGRPSATPAVAEPLEPLVPVEPELALVEEVVVVETIVPLEEEPEPVPEVADVVEDVEEMEVPLSAVEDVEGARLIALNMALNGQSRAETDRYLAENFDISDRDALLDEVYATVEG
jgi:hypothetical protein